MRRTEDRHHTPEHVNGYIEQALVLLDAHELSQMERAWLLPTIVTLLSAKQIFYEQIGALPNLAIPGNADH
jgi:hypothetical protein